jgi:hypothetical protein
MLIFIFTFFSSVLLYAIFFKPEARVKTTWQTAVNETIEEEFCSSVKKDLNAWEISKNIVHRKSFEAQLTTTISNIKASLGYFPKLFTVPSELPIKYYFDEKNTLFCDGATERWLTLIPQT